VVVPAGALKTGGQILSWNPNSSKKCVRLFQAIPIPRLQAILNKVS
jgi:hypothetical protein